MIRYTVAETLSDFEGILRLQVANLPSNISNEEAKQEGFVTLVHDLELLKEINTPYPHIIARDGNKIVGYALVTTIDKVPKIPLLQSTLVGLKGVKQDGTSILESKFFIMGQVCIGKSYRGQGIFHGLYQHMKAQMSGDFEFIITEISINNQRSLRAHQKVGFEILKVHEDNGEDWAIVGWKIS